MKNFREAENGDLAIVTPVRRCSNSCFSIAYGYEFFYHIPLALGIATGCPCLIFVVASLPHMSIIWGLVPSNILRTEGLVTQAMIGSVLGSVVNIILDPIFIFGLKQGAAGAAIATVLGNVIADIYYIYAIMKKAKRLSVSFSKAKISGEMIRNILAIGIPASIINLMQSFMVMMTNHFLLKYGNDKIAAMGDRLKSEYDYCTYSGWICVRWTTPYWL